MFKRPSCTEPAAVAPLYTDSTGRGALSFRIPKKFVGTINAQYIGVEGANLRSSGGLETASRWP